MQYINIINGFIIDSDDELGCPWFKAEKCVLSKSDVPGSVFAYRFYSTNEYYGEVWVFAATDVIGGNIGGRYLYPSDRADKCCEAISYYKDENLYKLTFKESDYSKIEALLKIEDEA